MDDVTADLLISELDAMEAVDREWEDNDVSDQPAAVPTEELEARCGHECLNQPDHDGPHFYGYIMGRHSYEGIKAERDALRERVATLEGGVRLAHNVIESLAFCIEDPDGNPHLPPDEYEAAMERIEAWRLRRARALLDVQGDTEGER